MTPVLLIGEPTWRRSRSTPRLSVLHRWSGPLPPPPSIGPGTQVAISDLAAYANMSSADVEAFGAELARICSYVEDSLGPNDASYIRRSIVFQTHMEDRTRVCSVHSV